MPNHLRKKPNEATLMKDNFSENPSSPTVSSAQISRLNPVQSSTEAFFTEIELPVTPRPNQVRDQSFRQSERNQRPRVRTRVRPQFQNFPERPKSQGCMK